jgi:hypothetical protein
VRGLVNAARGKSVVEEREGKKKEKQEVHSLIDASLSLLPAFIYIHLLQYVYLNPS